MVLLVAETESTFGSLQLVDPAGHDISGWGVEVTIGIEEGIPFKGVVRFAFPRPGLTPCTWLATLDRDDLMEWIGALSEAKMEEIDDALDSAGLDPVTLLPRVA